MDEEQKKGITILVGSTDCFNRNHRLYPQRSLIEAISKIDGVNALEVGKDHVTINPSLIKEIDDGLVAKYSGLLPGLGFGLVTDVNGIPVDLRNKNHPLARHTVGQHRKRMKRK